MRDIILELVVDILKQYEIAFKGLSIGSHWFDFEITDELAQRFDSDTQGISGMRGTAKVELVKRSGMMLMRFQIHALVRVACDICLDEFETNVEHEDELSVKFADEADDQQGEVIVLGMNADVLNVAQFIYEYVNYGLPYQRVHPRNEQGEITCNPEMIQKLDGLLVEENKPEEDPRWAALRKLKGD